MPCESGRRSHDHRPTVKQRFFDVSSDLGKFWRKSLNCHVTVVEVTRPSADCQIGRFKPFGKILKKVAERSRDSGRRSRDRRPTVKQRFLDVSSDLGKIWKKSLNCHAVEVTRPSADCQTTFFGRFKQFGIFLKKVAERSRDTGRRSRDCRPTVKQRFFDVSSAFGRFWKKSLNGHATVVGGHATVGRLSNNVFWTFQAIWENFEKSRWTVTRQWSEVTRPSADCQTTFFGRFKRFGVILKKVAERSRDSGRRSRDRRPTVKQRFLDVSSDLWKFWKKSLNGHATVVEVTRPSADCQTTFFGRFKQLEIFLKKVAERSRDTGRRSRDCRPTVKQRFLDVSSDFGRFWKKSLNGHATVVGGHATVGRLSNNVFWTFQAIWENFEKSRWTVTRQWLRSRDRRPTVKQRFLDVSSN